MDTLSDLALMKYYLFIKTKIPPTAKYPIFFFVQKTTIFYISKKQKKTMQILFILFHNTFFILLHPFTTI